MSSITTELAAALGAVDRPGDFYASGMTELHTPTLEVEGVGIVALPILPIQVAQLVAAAERAPYGRGQDTLVDTTVRRTWQIEADRVRIKGRHWAPMLEAVLTRVAEGLGVNGPIEAELYKLLVYDEGSFFVSHRDTEKVPGMFATLVLVLPSTSTGGELVVRHQGREVRLDLKCADPSELAFAAFYADCVHEVLPITSGCRVALVYNLTRRAKGALPQPPSYDAEQTRVTALLRAWVVAEEAPDDREPTKLIYLLEHAYTEAELGFDNLKGADAAVAGVVRAAAQKSECDLHVALFSIHESGSAEYVSEGGRWSDPELEAGEVDERVVMLSQWRRPDGSQPIFAELPVEDGELSPPDVVEDMEPDEEEFEEATGNAGASFERTYRRAALVLWPVKRAFAVLTQAGLGVTLPYLADLTERWASSGAGERSALWGQARELAGCMLAQWSMRGRHQWKDNTSDVTGMLTLLTRLKDTAHIDAFLSGVLGHGLHDKSDNKAIVIALQMLSPERAVALIERMITASTRSPAICSDLLARAVVALADNPGRLAEAAKVLVGALPGGSAQPVIYDSWSRPTGVSPECLVDLFSALARIEEAVASRAADHVLAWPKTYDLDTVLVPALCKLAKEAAINGSGAVERLRVMCAGHLRARLAEPLEEPRDWSRASALACNCVNCRELSRFLSDPMAKTWNFKAATSDRGHVEQVIKSANCDLDVSTETRGRPYSLVCKKNLASYKRRVSQRERDQVDLQKLDA